MQRFFDIIFSILALFIFSPLLVFIIVLLRFSGEGEIFFLQDRVGKDGEIFKLFKFVTMLKNSPNIGTGTVTMKDDPRVLPMGKILRKTKINELPQLLNIFFGDMSVIGPRPLTERSFDSYPVAIQKIIKQVRPGLSGIGSIIFRGEEDILHGDVASVDFYDKVLAPYKGDLEEWFVNHKGLYVYFMAIFITVWAIFIPSTSVAWRVFKDLPVPPEDLKMLLNYTIK